MHNIQLKKLMNVYCDRHKEIPGELMPNLAASDAVKYNGTRKDSKDGPAHPNIIYEESDDEASSSDKDVSDATLPTIKTLSIYLFFGGFGQEGQKRDSISQKQIPPMLLRSAYRGIERKDQGQRKLDWGIES
ncbi:hypothetical protein Lser_V15G26855 [Lactuca serriola]